MFAWLLSLTLTAAPPPQSGYRVVGLTADGRAVVHHVDGPNGIDRFELVAPAVAPVPCVELPASGTLPPSPGLVAPGASAVALVRVPGDTMAPFTVDLVDGDGDRRVVELATPCFDGSVGDGATSATVSWFAPPDSTPVMVVAGRLPACSGVERPFVEVVPVLQALTDVGRLELATRVRAEVESVGSMLKTPLAEALVGLDPGHASLVLLARTYASENDPGAAISTLWALSRRTDPGAVAALEAAIGSEWSTALAGRAAFRALVWTSVQARPSRPLVPDPP